VEFKTKGSFASKVSEIPCDTTEYELSLTPDCAVMNWYQCVGNWRLQWLVEDIQDVINSDGSEADIEAMTAKLNQRLSMEKVTPEKKHVAANAFFRAIGRGCPWGERSCYDDISVDARLFGCSCCGMKDYHDVGEYNQQENKFQFVPLSSLEILKLSEEEALMHNAHLNTKINIPFNEDGDFKVVNPWIVKSVYAFECPGDSPTVTYYHLHPELVLKPTTVETKTNPIAMICSDCAKAISCGKIPVNSIANGVDFGLGSRIGLEDPTARELHIVARIRYYYNIIKIESNTRRLREHQQSAIKGSSIMFEQDAPEVVSNLFSPQTMNSNVLLHFVGYKGEFNSLYKKTMKSKTADVFGRSWVVYQWLSVWKAIENPLYKDLHLPSYRDLKIMMDEATQSFVSESLKTFDDKLMEETAQMKDDVAGVRATTNPNMQMSHYANETDDNEKDGFALKYSLLTDNNTMPHKSNTDSSYIYLSNVARTMGINVDKEKAEYNAKSFRSQYPVNEFVHGEFGLVAAFPHVFMFGKAYKKDVSNLSLSDCSHLLLQFSSVAARCSILIFFLFDIQRRHDNIRAMAGRHRANPMAFEELSKEIASAEFHTKVQNAVADPRCKDAKYILRKLTPILTTAGKGSTFGALEKNMSLGETFAMIRRFGPHFVFLTIAFDDVNNPHTFRLTMRQPSNDSFPSVASKEFLNCMKDGRIFSEGNVKIPTNWSSLAKSLTENPVAAAFMYKRMLYYVMTILIGLQPAKLSDQRGQAKKTRRFTTKSLQEMGGVIAGHATAAGAVTEASQRGALHLHCLIHSTITAALLQGAVDFKEVCDTLTDVLDSIFSATIPKQYHVKYLIEKELPFYSTKRSPFTTVYRRPRAMLMPPDPLNDSAAFDDFVHSSICSFGIHSHDKSVTSRCHKPPKGLMRCALSKPSGIVEQTMPVQLVDTTQPPKNHTEKITINYQVRHHSEIQTRMESIQNLPPRLQVGPSVSSE
jgi:hypothetical protein